MNFIRYIKNKFYGPRTSQRKKYEDPSQANRYGEDPSPQEEFTSPGVRFEDQDPKKK